MEKRASKIGKPNYFHYISPNNGKWLQPAAAERVERLGLGGRVLSDMHVNSGGGVAAAQAFKGDS